MQFVNLILFQKKNSPNKRRVLLKIPGNFLLFHAGCPRSTIGAMELNFRVRDGIGCCLHAIITGKNLWEIGNITKFNYKKE
jgi:hypothetical protein